MTKARDISSLIGSSGQIDNTKITLDANEIPALDTAKITTGTFADARISSSSVSQHAQSFDDNKLVNDISTLALRQASDENKSAYNTNSSSVDVFQDSTGITNLTNAQRSVDEYVQAGTLVAASADHVVDSNTVLQINSNTTNNDTSIVDSSNNNISLSKYGNISHVTAQKKIGTSSIYFDGSNDRFNTPETSSVNLGNLTNFTWEMWLRHGGGNAYIMSYGSYTNRTLGRFTWNSGNPMLHIRSTNNWNWSGGSTINAYSDSTTLSNNTWYHLAVTKEGTSAKFYVDGVQTNTGTLSDTSTVADRMYFGSYFGQETFYTGYMDGFRLSNNVRYTGTFTPNPGIIVNATGSFEGTTVTAPSSVSSMGAIITYQNQAGTNALNTDIVLKLSADNGSNYSTATLTAMPDFSSGIKMAKVNDLSVTAGTQLKYKLEFANQASGTKEARIRGVALQY